MASASRRPKTAKGCWPRSFTLLRIGATQVAANTPEKKALLDKRDRLEEQIDKLKYEKAAHAGGRVQEAARRSAAGAGEDASGAGQMSVRARLRWCLARLLAMPAGSRKRSTNAARCAITANSPKRKPASASWPRAPIPIFAPKGLWGIERYQEANDRFAIWSKQHPKNAEYRVRWGRLFLERFNADEAHDAVQGSAEDRHKQRRSAYLGLALVASRRFSKQGRRVRAEGRRSRSKLFEAHELLALSGARRQRRRSAPPKKPTRRSPFRREALDAMAIHATIDLLDDKSDYALDGSHPQGQSGYGEAYATAGHFFVINRRYDEGIEAYRKALELNPRLWEARAQLGVNLMRLGQDDEARAAARSSATTPITRATKP